MRMILMLISGLFFTSAESDNFSRCPSSVIRNEYLRTFRERCYEFAIYREDYWADARDQCSHKGGSLATIPDLSTQKFFMQALHDMKSTRHGIWIGLNDRDSENHFKWVSGAPVNFTFWASGQPSLLHLTEDCVLMRNSKDYHWEGQTCHLWPRYYSYVCEFDMIPTTTSTTSTTTARPCPFSPTCTIDCGLMGFKTDPGTGCPVCECAAVV